MERLTTRCYANLIKCQDCIEESNCYFHSCDEIEKAIQKLAEYEDIGLTPEEIIEEIKILEHNNKCMEDTLERQYDNAKKLVSGLEEQCDYWKREALKWANEIGEQRIGPLLWMDEERGKNEGN